MLGLQLADTRVYREAKDEGRQEGRQEGEFSLIVRLLKRRFGSVEEALESHIQHLSVEQLESLGEALLDFTELDDLVLWLNRHCP